MPRIKAANLAEHHELTWQRLLDALEGLLADRDYEAITLADVATRAGIARNTIYNYAPDRSTLLARAAERAGRGVSERVAALAGGEAPAADRLAAIVAELVESFAHGAIRHVLLQQASGRYDPGAPHDATSPYEALIGHVRDVVGAGVQAGEFRPVADLDLTVSLLAGLVRSGIDQVATVDPAGRVLIAGTVVDLLLRSLRPDRTCSP